MISIKNEKQAKSLLKSIFITYEYLVSEINDLELNNRFLGLKYTYKQIMNNDSNLYSLLLDLTILNGEIEKETVFINNKFKLNDRQKAMINQIKYLSLNGQANYLRVELNNVNKQNKGLLLSNNKLKENNKELREIIKKSE